MDHYKFSSTGNKCLLLVLLLLNILSAKAQRSLFGDVTIASPTAASLGKFGDIPVNNHTGNPQINIPIYEIESGPLKLPVSLSYHSSGLKVLDPAGWVGAGWALNAGGVISRTVMGAPDERNTSSAGSQYGYFSDYGYHSYLYSGDMQDWQAFASGQKDGEPDLFFYNFNGYSGKFYFSDDRLPVLIPEQDLKIEYSYSGSGSISSFIITTPDGTRYYFGATAAANDVDPVETTAPMNMGNGYNASSTISSWYLNKIESEDGMFAINLTYQQETYSYFTWSLFPISSQDQTTKKEYSLVKMFQNGVRLDKIAFPNGHIDFIPGAVRADLGGTMHDFTDDMNTSATTLGAINITNDKNFCKKWQFFYNYFEDNIGTLPDGTMNIETDRKKLKLDSIQEKSCNAAIVLPPYKFDYYTERVPRRLSFSFDHWGYSNGRNNQSLIPAIKVDGTNIPGANRDATWPDMRGGALRKIVYPTGGSTDFEFEAHRTNVSYSRDIWTNLATLNIGYDGSNPRTITRTITLKPGTYTITVSTSSGGSNASFTVQDITNNITVAAMTASSTNPSDGTREKVVYCYGGTYQLTLSKETYGTTGVGASGSVMQSVPSSYVVDTIIGGLRIKKITAHDHVTGNDKVTSYTYKAGNNSSGILFGRPTYVQTLRNDLIRDLGYWNPATGYEQSCSPQGCITCTVFPYYKSPSSIRPMASTQGYHIGYSEVTIRQPGNGYSVYRYNTGLPYGYVTDNVANLEVSTASCDAQAPNFPPAPLPYVYIRGELANELHFREDGKLLNERIYNYTFSTPVVNTYAFIAAYYKTSFGNIILGTNYSLSTAKKIQTIITENNSDRTNGISMSSTTTNDYLSTSHHEITSSKTLNSTGDEFILKSKYAFDFRTSCDAIADCKSAYATANNSCQNTYVAELGACGTSLCRTNAYLKYQKCLSQSRVGYVNCRRTNFTDPGNAFGSCLQNSINNADVYLKPILKMQQQYKNAALEVTTYKNGKILKSAFNKYGFALNPTWNVVPEKLMMLNLSSLSATFTETAINGNSITKDSRYQEEMVVKYDKGNQVQTLGKDGIIKSYIFDYNNTLPVAIVTNAPSDQIAYTSFEADGGGYWFFSGTVVNDNTAPTGDKCYNLGSGGMVKSGLSAASKYVVSYWTKNTQPYGISGTQGLAVKVRSKNGWTYFEHKVSGVSEISVAGNGFVDEVRLYPEDAQIRTFSYSPMIGVTSECDFKGLITYYVYDDLGRLRMIKDLDGNIRKLIHYNHNGQPEDNGQY
ncbi:hypothetical protein [Chitinophaga solisilvae]|uniref:hypothetical protein n=1 Tax=Chitinophaga solisilvae TaxID=1233460 RepID=UPI00136DC008|nr:hypothetical protein [Chitinophaga solisilvae]